MKRNKFSLSHYKLTTTNMGVLMPIGIMEALPGDTIQQASSVLVRVAPLLAPVMHPVHAEVFHFFVAHRLIWEEWEKFITGGTADGSGLPTAPVFPTVDFSGSPVAANSIADALGVPPGVNYPISALPFRAYNKIYNDWFRDEDLDAPLAIDLGSGADTTTALTGAMTNWSKDYFTVARPWAQKGSDITIPFGASSLPVTRVSNAAKWLGVQAGNNAPATNSALSLDGADLHAATGDAGNPTDISLDPNGGLIASLASAGANLNELRLAFAVQRYEEARARYGSRYTEYLRYLGVRSSDARLQRSEYLGGGRETIQFSEVLQTGVTTDGDDTEGVGNLKGHGIGALKSNRYRRFFEEHGYIMSFIVVRPKPIYMQTLGRHWSKTTKEDFWQRELEHVGQQEVPRKELYATASAPTTTFGYVDRYQEYREIPSEALLAFRDSQYNFWHFGRSFSADPQLNPTFLQCAVADRPFAVNPPSPPESEAYQLQLMVYHSVQARRLVTARPNGKVF